MPTAFVTINSESGFMDSVLKELKIIKGVIEAYKVYGVFDIVAKVEAENMTKLNEIVTENIRVLNKVLSTSTMIIREAIWILTN